MTAAARPEPRPEPRPETLFARDALWQSWLDVEAALARAQARIGMIPEAAAAEISRVAHLDVVGRDALQASIRETRAPIMSLSRCLAEAAGEAGRWVHWGATTQNVMQTGRLLLIRQGRRGMDAALSRAAASLADLARRHAGTPMAGRTNRRHALPVTFGFKVAGWIEETDRAVARLDAAAARTFRLPFGGAVGAHHSYGADGPRLIAELARELDLGELLVASRTVNDLFVDYVVALSMLGMTVERMAREIYALMGEEIDELRERHEAGVVGSSAMPHKVNPKHVVRLQAECARLRALAAPAMEAGLPSHEGDAAANHLLSAVVDQAVPLAWTLAEGLADLLERIEVDAERMAANLARSSALLSTERLMMTLARETGRGAAHDLVHEVVEAARLSGADLVAAALDVPEVAALGEDEVRSLLDATTYVGASAEIARAAADRGDDLGRRLRDAGPARP
jgi:3-carboxy-cis,cis-muconate cycloisomerase